MSKYWVQERAPDGSWSGDLLGTDDRKEAISFAKFEAKNHGVEARVVVRTDKEIFRYPETDLRKEA